MYCLEAHALAVHGAAHSQAEDRPSLYSRPCMSLPKDLAYFYQPMEPHTCQYSQACTMLSPWQLCA